jgi:DNA-binding phage protein
MKNKPADEIMRELLKKIEEQNLTAYQLYKQTGIPQTTISAWRTGGLPRLDSLIALCDALNIQIVFKEKKTSKQVGLKSRG